MEHGNGRAGTFVLGLFVGALAGAGAALLLAPQSGDETRARIRHTGEELRDKAEEALTDARRKVESVVTDVEHRAEELLLQGQVVIKEGQEQLARAVDETKQAAQAATAQ